MSKRRLLVGIAAEATEEPWRIEDERRPDHRHTARQHSLERQPQLPTACRGRLEQRVRSRAPKRLRAAGAEQRAGAAVQHGLGGGDAHDEVGLEQPRIDAYRRSPGVAQMDELRRFCVVNDDDTVKAAGGHRRKERLLLPVPGPPVESSRDQDRL